MVLAVSDIEAEIIVVDNDSDDDSCEMVKAEFPEVKLIENTENLGFSKGNNIGVKAAKGEYICILNPDTVVPETGFKTLLDFAEGKSNMGILGCQLVDGKGKFLPESKRNIPTPWVALQKMLGHSRAYYANHVNRIDVAEVDVLVGAFMLIKRQVYDEVGGFDEDYFMYGEDIDLSYKILNKGYSNYYYGKVSVMHFKGESTLRNKTYAKRFFGAMKLFYKKHFKSNVVFNTVVFIGIKVASLLKTEAKENKVSWSQTLIFSDRSDTIKRVQLPQPLITISDLKDIQADSLVILDANVLSYNAIIQAMKANNQKQNIAFRIWPKNSNFSLGSDSTTGRGEVIKF